MIKDAPWVPIALAGLFGIWGLAWGLPSKERAALFLKPEMQNEAFFQKIEKARDAAYEQFGGNPIAYYGRLSREGKSYGQTVQPLAAYSSFLVRTHHADEQQALVMLSRFNPFQGKWYPYTFQYGGAYIYPLGFYLKILQTLGVIQLVSQASYYYANPDKIAKVYLAVRLWSVIALMLAVVPLFYLGRRLVGTEAAFWASCFFALVPACIANAKLVKPHTWAAFWMLSSLYFCLRAREDTAGTPLGKAAICYGLALGTTISQAVFAPFLLWACWGQSLRDTIRRIAAVVSISGIVFLATNFYIISHLQDFRDELFLFKSFYPFGVTLQALWDFFYGALRPSLGTFLWVFVLAGVVYGLIQRNDPRLRILGGLSVLTATALAFQNQSLLGHPVMSRLFLALVGLWCLYAAWLIQRLPQAPWLQGVTAIMLILMAVPYARHYASDHVPVDNASLASGWVRDNVLPGSVIGQDQTVPHTFEFPPIDFSAYRILKIGSPEFESAKGRTFAILPVWSEKSRRHLLESGYTLVKVFAESPLQKLGFSDSFTTANFVLEVYARQGSSK